MATLIPALGSCAARMTSGERRLAERLEQKLDDDYLLWYDVPVGPKQTHPDFVVIHPRRGLLILEVKDWRLDTIRSATRERFEIVPDGQLKVVINPLMQARHCAIQVVNALNHKAGNEAQARDATRNAYSHLRMAWERCVEEVLLQGVVTRFKEGISTQPLPGVTVEDNDVKAVDVGMTKSSKFSGHDPAAYAQLPTPDPSELLTDIERLEAWRKAVVARADATKARRKAAV